MDAPGNQRQFLATSLKQGRLLIGEVLLGRDFSLRHAGDADRTDLTIHTDPLDAREIARYDCEGNFRPLKSAPNLRRGWVLKAGSLEGMELALEFLYPAALGLCTSWMRGTLDPTTLRETLDRQTGMFRVTQLLRNDQAHELIQEHCSSCRGCLRTILWEIDHDLAITGMQPDKIALTKLSNDRIPLICREACNLLVAAARPIAKGNASQGQSSQQG